MKEGSFVWIKWPTSLRGKCSKEKGKGLNSLVGLFGKKRLRKTKGLDCLVYTSKKIK